MEQKLAKRGRFDNPNDTELFKLAMNTDLTLDVFADVLFGVRERQHTVACVSGPTGTGKSRIMQMLASLSRNLKWALHKISADHIVTWSPVQSTAKAQLGLLQDWTDMTQDEYRSRNVGKGSATSDAGFRTLTETLRANKNSFWVASVHDPVLTPHFSLRALGWHKEFEHPQRGKLYNVNEAIVMGPQWGYPMGVVYMDQGYFIWTNKDGKEVPEGFEGIKYVKYPDFKKYPKAKGLFMLDPYILKTYHMAKMQYNNLVKRYGGTPPEYDPDVLEYVKREFRKYLEEEFPENYLEMSKSDLEFRYMQAELPAIFYMDKVIGTISSEFRIEKKEKEKQKQEEEFQKMKELQEKEENLVKELAFKLVNWVQKTQPDPDKDRFPAKSICNGWLKRLDALELRTSKTTVYEMAKLMWWEMQSDWKELEKAKEEALRPPPIPPADFPTKPRHWFDHCKEKFFDSVAEDLYWDAYENYAIKEEHGWTSQQGVVEMLEKNGLPRSRRTIRKWFKVIEGLMKREMGYELERTLLEHVFLTSQFNEAGIIVLEPKEGKPAPKGQPDFVLKTPDESLIILSIKCHNRNPDIGVEGPELKLYKHYLDQGKKNISLHLAGLFKGYWFTLPIPANLSVSSVTVRENFYKPFPPIPEDILSLKVKNQENQQEDQVEEATA